MLECKACGYKYEEEYQTVNGKYKKVVINGDNEFIEINGHFTYNDNGWHNRIHEVSLYACPKCHTVIADL